MQATILISILQTIIVSMLIYYLQRRQVKLDEKLQIRSAARKKESLLALELNMANAHLTHAVAIAVKRGRANGEIEEAIQLYDKAKKEYFDFINEQANEHLYKK